MTFTDDIKSKDLNSFVLVVIEKTVLTTTSTPGICYWPPNWGAPPQEITEEACENAFGDYTPGTETIEESVEVLHRISTKKITFDNEYYQPILLKSPSISESLGIQSRKYKISNVSLSISDYLEDGKRFSDNLNSLLNSEVNIWFASPSSMVLEQPDCYLAGTYIIRSFSQSKDKVTLSCEDLSQNKLHKDVPLTFIPDDDSYKDKNKPIPITFGAVDRSPCVFYENKIKIDTEPIAQLVSSINELNGIDFVESDLYVFMDSSYININKERLDGVINWYYDDFVPEITLEEDSDLVVKGIGHSDLLRKVTNTKPSGTYHNPTLDCDQFHSEPGTTNVGGWDDTYWNDISVTYQNRLLGDTQDDEESWWKFELSIESSTIETSCETFLIGRIENQADDGSGYKAEYILLNFSFPANETEPLGDDYVADIESYHSRSIDSFNAGSNKEEYPLPEWTSPGQFNHIIIKIPPHEDPSFLNIFEENISIDIKFKELWIYHKLIIENIFTKQFFANVRGRHDGTFSDDVGQINAINSPTAVLSNILQVELDFNNINDLTNGLYNDWHLAFSVNTKINSKKLLEEISASTPLFPYFKNNTFNITSINTTYTFSNYIIKAEDVIDYKFNKTSINKVYTKVNVKYKYDYGLREYAKETGFIYPTDIVSILGEYTPYYYGADFDQELVFESKYIRSESRANTLALYLAGSHANQHNIIELTLPVNYMDLELTNIVEIDKLIEDRTMFGEDYTTNQIRNGQGIYKYFFIEQIKKSLDRVTVKLYQLHSFSNDEGQALVPGCTNPLAENYNAEATYNDGTCTFTYGCMLEDAINYNPDAIISDDSCIFPVPLQPAIINSPENNYIIPIGVEPTVDSMDIKIHHSPNFFMEIPGLELDYSGSYDLYIYQEIEEGVWGEDGIPAGSVDANSIWWLGDPPSWTWSAIPYWLGLPQNVPLLFTIQLSATTQYDGNYVFSPHPDYPSLPPLAFSSQEFSWGALPDEPAEIIIGDINSDELVNVVDIVLIVGYILGNTTLTDDQFTAADYNSDGTVNVVDIINLVGIIIYGE